MLTTLKCMLYDRPTLLHSHTCNTLVTQCEVRVQHGSWRVVHIACCSISVCSGTTPAAGAHPVVDMVGDLGPAWNHVLGHIDSERGLGKDGDYLRNKQITSIKQSSAVR
jgi:hypothetical protein